MSERERALRKRKRESVCVCHMSERDTWLSLKGLDLWAG